MFLYFSTNSIINKTRNSPIIDTLNSIFSRFFVQLSKSTPIKVSLLYNYHVTKRKQLNKLFSLVSVNTCDVSVYNTCLYILLISLLTIEISKSLIFMRFAFLILSRTFSSDNNFSIALPIPSIS